MREKKYANILDDFPEDVVQEIKDEIHELEDVEEKLSMTRELKFKELQDGIDNEQKTENDEVVSTHDTNDELIDDEPIIREVDLSLSKKEMKKQFKEEKKAKKKAQEDLYLTSSFKPLRNRFRLKKVFKVLFSLIFTIGILTSVAYFLILPLYNKYLASKPRAIFEHSIDYVAEELTKMVSENYFDNIGQHLFCPRRGGSLPATATHYATAAARRLALVSLVRPPARLAAQPSCLW